MHVRELLIETYAHIPPARAIEALSAEEAERHIASGPHSIAEIVAHMNFWQEWFCSRAEGKAEPVVRHAALGWPVVVPGAWPDIHQRFLAGLQRAAALGGDPAHLAAPVSPAIEYEPLAHYTVGDVLVHVGTHNAHHLGQIILLRQLMGLWPPPSGSYTW
jgi:uncharacterized damage-inducible protein DinB